jgi:geranylgeranyl pyrophosphate synthase
LPEQIWQIIERSWSQSLAWQEFTSAMRIALPRHENTRRNPDQDPSKWAVLPGLCCHAAGGRIHWANDIAAAWLLFYIAADIMDTVEDSDLPQEWWQEIGPGAAINVASGYFFCAARLLESLHQNNKTSLIATEIIDRLTNGFLVMCSGQQRDLTERYPSIKSYWQIAEAKSGEFFGMACWAGARLSTGHYSKLKRYQDFGRYLGSLIQLLDDLEEFKCLREIRSAQEWQNMRKSLPFVYALEVFPEVKRKRLVDLLDQGPDEESTVDEATHLLEESGVVVYLLAEMERNRNSAKQCLLDANPDEKAAEYFDGLLNKLVPKS